jgi:dynactin complex subunit
MDKVTTIKLIRSLEDSIEVFEEYLSYKTDIDDKFLLASKLTDMAIELKEVLSNDI